MYVLFSIMVFIAIYAIKVPVWTRYNTLNWSTINQFDYGKLHSKQTILFITIGFLFYLLFIKIKYHHLTLFKRIWEHISHRPAHKQPWQHLVINPCVSSRLPTWLSFSNPKHQASQCCNLQRWLACRGHRIPRIQNRKASCWSF